MPLNKLLEGTFCALCWAVEPTAARKACQARSVRGAPGISGRAESLGNLVLRAVRPPTVHLVGLS